MNGIAGAQKSAESLASLSTGDSSGASSSRDEHVEHGSPCVLAQTDGARQHPRRRALLRVAVLAVLAWGWSRYMGKVLKRPQMWGHARIALLAAAGIGTVARRLGIKTFSQAAVDPSCAPGRQALMVFHPHGCYVLGGIINLTPEPRNKNSGFHGYFIGVADVLFKVPLVREFLLIMNCRPATPQMTDALLANGQSVALCPGGIHEQMSTDPTIERVFFPQNLGFVRQALKHGVPLLPLYTFGENQLYDVPGWSRRLSATLKKLTGAGIPLAVGRWGLPFVPKKTSVYTHLGDLVEVGDANPSPTDVEVKETFLRYCLALRQLFEKHKDVALPPDVAARGLTMVWREHESEDLDAQILSMTESGRPQQRQIPCRIEAASSRVASRL